jgi:excisionase family DNA binding protein
MEQLLLTPREVAKALNVSKNTVERLIASGELPVLRIRRTRRISVQQLETYIAKLENGADTTT